MVSLGMFELWLLLEGPEWNREINAQVGHATCAVLFMPSKIEIWLRHNISFGDAEWGFSFHERNYETRTFSLSCIEAIVREANAWVNLKKARSASEPRFRLDVAFCGVL